MTLALLAVPASRAPAHLAVIRQGPESAGTLEDNDRTGHALAVGDFNGDGYQDLAIGAPNDAVGALANAGAVIVVYGSKNGLTHVGADLRTANSTGNTSSAGAQFGYSLAAGNFNGDLSGSGNPYDDLAIGAPFDPVGTTARSGRVYVLHGGAGGIGASTFVTLTQGPAGGSTELDDDFGYALATGNFDGNAYDDLAIGDPGEDADAGAVFHYYGTNIGITGAGAGFYKQADLGGTNVGGDRFGGALATGNLYDSSHDDLAVSAPYRSVGGTDFAGVVYLIRGSAGGLISSSAHAYSAANVDAVIGSDLFGASLAAGQMRSSTFASVAIGEPNRDVGGHGGAGRVVVVEGANGGLDFAQKNILNQTGAEQEGNDSFGWSVAVGPWDLDSYDDLAVGSQGETVAGNTSVGTVLIYTGRSTGPTTAFVTQYQQEDLNDVSEGGDRLGASVAFGRFDASGRASLAAGAPDEDTSNDILYSAAGVDVEEFTQAGQVFIIAPWRQAMGLRCRNALVTDCQGEYVYSLKPFDRVRVASTTKVMTLMRACERNGVDVDTADVVPIRSWMTDPGKITGTRWTGPNGEVLDTDQTWKLIDLMRVSVTYSANDATYAVAEHLIPGVQGWEGQDHDTCSEFVDEMNARAAALGMTRTHFENPPGRYWNDPYSTAEDMAKLMRAAMQNQLFKQLAGTETQTIRFSDPELNPTNVKFDKFFSWLDCINDNDRNAIAIKPGSNDPSQQTMVFASAPPGGLVIGTGFGWRRAAPADGSRATICPDMAALLVLGENACGSAPQQLPAGAARDPMAGEGPARGPLAGAAVDAARAFAPGAPAAQPQPEPPLIIMPNLSTFTGTLHGGGAEAGPASDDSLIAEAIRQQGTGVTSFLMEITRTTEVTIGPVQSVDFGVAPFEGYAGFWVVNSGSLPAMLRISLSHPPAQQVITLDPDSGTIVIPPYGGPRVPRFTLRIENLGSAAHALLSVQELGYIYSANLAAAPDRFQVVLRRPLAPRDDGLIVYLVGQDANPGNDVYVTVHSPQLTVAVDEPGDRGGPPLATAGVWPNPCRDRVRLVFELRRAGKVELSIFDLLGRRVGHIPARAFPAGRWSLDWSGSGAGEARPPSGLYFYRLTLDGEQAATGKLVVAR